MVATQTRPQLLLASRDPSVTVLPSENVRGYDVRDMDNHSIGTVDDLVADAGTGRVRFLMIGDGGILGIGRTHRLIPVDVVKEVTGTYVFLDRTKDQISGAPTWQPLDDEAYLAGIVRYYGCRPFWASDYRIPDWTNPG